MKIITIIGSIALVVIIALISLIMFVNRKVAEDSEPCFPSAKVPSEYLQLLHLPDSCCNSISKITFVATMGCSYRKPISYFLVESKYYLQIYKMDSSFTSTLTNAVKESYSNVNIWTNTTYDIDNKTDMEFFYKSGKPKKVKNIYFNLFGDSTRVLQKNDTVAYYYSKCTSFSLKFNLQDQNDIYGELKSDNSSEVPLEILFLKKDKRLFLLILSCKNANSDLNPNMLHDLYFKK